MSTLASRLRSDAKSSKSTCGNESLVIAALLSAVDPNAQSRVQWQDPALPWRIEAYFTPHLYHARQRAPFISALEIQIKWDRSGYTRFSVTLLLSDLR